MKQRHFDEKKTFHDILLIIAIITCFVFIVAFCVYYVSDVINKGNACNCLIPIPLMILLLSSLGVFVGSLIYYFLSSKFSRKRKEYTKDIGITLRFLGKEEKKIIKILIKAKRELSQSQITKEAQLNKVKVSRLIQKLMEKEIIIKREKGKINYISLHNDLKKIFI